MKGHNFINEIQTISQVFYPNEKFILLDSLSSENATIVSELQGTKCISVFYENGTELIRDTCYAENTDIRELKRLVKLSMFTVLKQKTGAKTPWGLLTGIRPAKIVSELLDRGFSETESTRFISKHYLISSDKIRLMTDVALRQRAIGPGNGYSLYIGIPFCPSRCRYCSFTSYPISKYDKSDSNESKINDYINSISKELAQATDFIAGKAYESVYIGGGTPVSLSPDAFDDLLSRVAASIGGCAEFTVEAGRPDAITAEKLQIMKNCGVTRLSINPQTMNDDTLARIGRAHTSNEFIEKFKLARSMGFDNINTDLILGLPGEDISDVRDTFEKISKLNPESVTVHTLAIKRASGLKEELLDGGDLRVADTGLIEDMLELSAKYTHEMGLIPYYMYRQKNSLGNFENVGYSKPGFECLYNIRIMEEKQSIIAAGAGGVSKVVFENGRIERAFNVKNVDEYLARIDEMLERKERMMG